ncbi:MAG: SDR family oxidoreductase [Actinomycetota bacterium]|nr:SDR family oxidoreductase [Actinomycetota bacterium]
MSTRRALITGGSGGIGLAVGGALVHRGYEVVLNARRQAPLVEAAESIGARWVTGDCAAESDAKAVVAAAGPVDLLVHAAGLMAGTFIRKESVETFDALLSANLRSSFLVSRAVLETMPSGGRMIFLSSSSSHAPQPGKAAYSASKAGLNAFALALAAEVERDGIAVHTVTPAPVATAMLDDVRFPMYALASEQVAEAVIWLDSLDGSIVLPEIELRATATGPFAPELFVPEAARALGRTTMEQ